MGIIIETTVDLHKEQLFEAVEKFVIGENSADLKEDDVLRLRELADIAHSRFHDPEGNFLEGVAKDARDAGLPAEVAETAVTSARRHFPGMAITTKPYDDWDRPGMKLLEIAIEIRGMTPEEVSGCFQDMLAESVRTVKDRHNNRVHYSFDFVDERRSPDETHGPLCS